MTPTPAKAWSNPQKPRTVKQQKNKKRQKEMEKEFSKNERWRCLSEGPPVDHTRYQQVTIIPLSYDERAVDCEGLDESHPKDRGYHGRSDTIAYDGVHVNSWGLFFRLQLLPVGFVNVIDSDNPRFTGLPEDQTEK